MNSCWKNKWLLLFSYFLLEASEVEGDLSVFYLYLRCEHLSFEGKPSVNTLIYTAVQFLVINAESKVQLYSKKERETKYCAKLVPGLMLNESFTICSIVFFPELYTLQKQNSTWTAEQAEATIHSIQYKDFFFLLNFTLNIIS